LTPPAAATAAARTKPAVRVRSKPAAPAAPAPKQRGRAAARPQRPAAKSRQGASSRRAAARPARPKARPSSSGRPRARRTSGAAGPRVAERALPQIAVPKLPDLRPYLRALPALRPVPVLGAVGSHAFRAGRRLPDSPLVDRLLRGRLWIGLMAVLLFGLVAINVSLLKLNAQAGRNAEKVKTLKVQNDRLHAKVSRLRSGDRVERVAARLGLVMPEAGSIRYVSIGSRDGSRAAGALRAGKRTPTSGPLPGIVTNPVSASPVAVTPVTTPGDTAATGTQGAATVTPQATDPATQTGTALGTAQTAQPVTPTGGGAAPTTDTTAPSG
jgi:hypothetical protein